MSAEASRTDAGTLSATAAAANRRLATFGRCFPSPVRNQLIDQAAIWCDVSEKTSHPLRSSAATFNLGFVELSHACHTRTVSADQDPECLLAADNGAPQGQTAEAPPKRVPPLQAAQADRQSEGTASDGIPRFTLARASRRISHNLGP
jgi:hypothetical protein